MRSLLKLFLIITAFAALALISATVTEAQPGGKKKAGSETLDEFVAKLMAFNKAKDGKLTKTELTDPRLHDLFDRADANKDGAVTRAELETLFGREKLEGGGDKGKGGPGDKKKDGFGGDKKGKGDFKDFKGKGGPPQPGTILSPFLQDSLNLNEDQRKQLADLQKDVDERLSKILTEGQRTQLREMGKGFGAPFGEKKGPFGDKKGPFGDKKGPPGK